MYFLSSSYCGNSEDCCLIVPENTTTVDKIKWGSMICTTFAAFVHHSIAHSCSIYVSPLFVTTEHRALIPRCRVINTNNTACARCRCVENNDERTRNAPKWKQETRVAAMLLVRLLRSCGRDGRVSRLGRNVDSRTPPTNICENALELSLFTSVRCAVPRGHGIVHQVALSQNLKVRFGLGILYQRL